MEYIINHIRLCGTMETAPVFSHENHGRRFYSFILGVERLSGTLDRLDRVRETVLAAIGGREPALPARTVKEAAAE